MSGGRRDAVRRKGKGWWVDWKERERETQCAVV
jgi:hypothetical protein